MNNFELIKDLIQHIETKEQLAMLILQIIQQGKEHKLDNIDMVNYWLNINADKVESEVEEMVCDRLHIICGNCGELLSIDNDNNKKARASIERDYKGNLEDVFITCENCATVHSLSKYMEILG